MLACQWHSRRTENLAPGAQYKGQTCIELFKIIRNLFPSCCRWLHRDTWLGRSVTASAAMDAALLSPGQPHVLQQQLLAAAALKMMEHCDYLDDGALDDYQSAAIAHAVSLEAQVRRPHPCA